MKIHYPVEYSRQLAQFLDSYVRVTGHEPPPQEIAAFESRQYVMAPPLTPIGGERQGLARCNGEARVIARAT